MADEQKKGPAGADLIEEINEDFDTFEAWITERWRLIAAVCVAIVAVVAVVGVVSAVSKASSRKVAQTFANADSYEKLQEALKAHPNAPSAPDARMKLAMMQIEKKDYAGAIASFKTIGDSKTASDALRVRASLNSGYVLELQGKTEEALLAYAAIGQNISNPDEIRAEANYAAGRLYAEKKDFEKAKSSLSKASTAKPRSMAEFFWSTQAKGLLDRVSASVPAQTATKPKG